MYYLRDIIREEELMKYASKAGVTSFQKSVVKTYMKGINESQLAAKYDVMTNAIHEAIYGYVTTCRRYPASYGLVYPSSYHRPYPYRNLRPYNQICP